MINTEIDLQTSIVTKIDGKWTTKDLVQYIESIEFLMFYIDFGILLEDNSFSSARKNYKLLIVRINSIKYNSPGVIELVQNAALIAAVIALIRKYIPNKNERINNEILEQQLLEKKIENIERLYDIEEENIQNFIKINKIKRGNVLYSNLRKLKEIEKTKEKKIKIIENLLKKNNITDIYDK